MKYSNVVHVHHGTSGLVNIVDGFSLAEAINAKSDARTLVQCRSYCFPMATRDVISLCLPASEYQRHDHGSTLFAENTNDASSLPSPPALHSWSPAHASAVRFIGIGGEISADEMGQCVVSMLTYYTADDMPKDDQKGVAAKAGEIADFVTSSVFAFAKQWRPLAVTSEAATTTTATTDGGYSATTPLTVSPLFSLDDYHRHVDRVALGPARLKGGRRLAALSDSLV